MEQAQQDRTVYRFGKFTFDAHTGELERGGSIKSLRPQVAATLTMLLDRPGELVAREDLRDELWRDGRIVSFDMAISTVMRQLRRALGDDPREPSFIETIPKRGYRFRCRVESVPRSAPASSGRGATPLRRRVSHAAGLVLIAFATLLLGGTASPPVSRSSSTDAPLVAVLPFSNLTGEASQDVHAHAVTDAVIGYLSRVAPSRLRVAGLASVLPYAGSAVDPARVGTELGADFLLEGSFARQGDAAVASVRLLSPGDATVIWSREYRRVAESPELAARSIAALTAEELAGTTLALEGSAAAENAPEAVARVRRAVYLRDRFGRTRGIEALEELREAVAIDPDYAAAHAALAETLIGPLAPHPTPERVKEALAAATRALELDPLSAAAHRVLGDIRLYYDRDWDGAGDHLARAAELAPGSAPMHHALALWLSARGRHAEAVAEIELARVLDPRSIAVSTDVLFIRLYARDYAGTIEAAQRRAQLQPESTWHRRWHIVARLGLGDLAGAAHEARAGLVEELVQFGAAEAGPPAGDEQAVRAYFDRLAGSIEAYARERPFDPVALAQWFAQAGETGRAADLVRQGLNHEYFSYYVPFLGVSPLFDPLRGSVAFETQLRGLAQSGLSPVGAGLTLAARDP